MSCNESMLLVRVNHLHRWRGGEDCCSCGVGIQDQEGAIYTKWIKPKVPHGLAKVSCVRLSCCSAKLNHSPREHSITCRGTCFTERPQQTLVSTNTERMKGSLCIESFECCRMLPKHMPYTGPLDSTFPSISLGRTIFYKLSKLLQH